jgi:hypothetical protein
MTCAVCGNPNTEKHHIVFKSQGGLDADWNIIHLCPRCHRGKYGPHKCRERDLYLKRSVQDWLSQQLTEPHYEDKPAIFTDNEWRRITKSLDRQAEGYSSVDIIRRCMGWKLY